MSMPHTPHCTTTVEPLDQALACQRVETPLESAELAAALGGAVRASSFARLPQARGDGDAVHAASTAHDETTCFTNSVTGLPFLSLAALRRPSTFCLPSSLGHVLTFSKVAVATFATFSTFSTLATFASFATFAGAVRGYVALSAATVTDRVLDAVDV